jgi:hypothetical protein
MSKIYIGYPLLSTMCIRMLRLFFILVIIDVADILDIVYRFKLTRFVGWICLRIRVEWGEIPSPK